MGATLYLDLTRLLQAAWRRTPSGIERIEFAYTRELGGDSETIFVAGQFGRILALPKRPSLKFLRALQRKWLGGNSTSHIESMGFAVIIYLTLLLKTVFTLGAGAPASPSVYLNLSHENLRTPRALAGFKSRTGAKILCFVHDLIPITHPEYARAGQAARHRRRIETIAALADSVIVNSSATGREFLKYLGRRQRLPAVHVIYPGMAMTAALSETAATTPYFLFVATIEPRKNHLLLLNLWRDLHGSGAAVPRLVLVGRRGWENEMVIDMLERCTALAGLVEERGAVGDHQLARLMKDARALLLPSFAEGFGLTVPEALAAGTPVLCSDLPALRETGKEVPEYLDPLDGPGWRQAILDYAAASSPRRDAQCARLQGWSAPGWDEHFLRVRDIILQLPAASRA